MPIDRTRYPPDWKQISYRIRFVRAGGRCEWPGCGAKHGQPHPITGKNVNRTTEAAANGPSKPGTRADQRSANHKSARLQMKTG